MIKTVKLTANQKTEVMLTGGCHCCIENRGSGTVYASKKADIAADADGVAAISSGNSKILRNAAHYCVENSTYDYRGKIYLLSDSDGKVEIQTADDLHFFKPGGSGGGEAYDDTAVKADISALQTGKADKTSVYTKSETDTKITEKVAEIVADAPEDFNTLKEMSDWIASHEEDASAMNSAILANTSNIAALQTEIVNTDVSQISSVTPVLQNNTEYRYINGSVSSITISAGNDISNDDFISSVVFKAAGTAPVLTVSFSFSYINDEISLSDGKQYCMIFFNDGFGIKCVWYEV